MEIGLFASIFLLSVATGTAASLLVIAYDDLEPKFFRANAIISAVLSVAAALLIFSGRKETPYAFEFTLIFTAAMWMYATFVLVLPRPVERGLLVVAAIVGIAGQTVLIPAGEWHPWGRYVTAAELVLSGLVVAAALVAMNVGHWYLSATQFSIRPLRRISAFLGILIGLEVIWWVIGRGLFGEPPMFQSMKNLDAAHLVDFSLIAVRYLFGLLGPVLLMVMTWQTVKIKSTQSATGILFAMLGMLLAGEAASMYLVLLGGS